MNKAELEAEAAKVSTEVEAYLTGHVKTAWFIYGFVTCVALAGVWALVH